MREMKDSGFEWIGPIPRDWSVVKLKNIKDSIPYAIVDGPFGTAISTNDYVDAGVPLIRIINIQQPGMTDENLIFITEEHADSLTRSSIHKGDIVFAKTGATVGKCAINDKFDYGIMSSSCVKISLSADYDNRYYYYFFYTDQFQNELRNACAGTTRDTINLQPFSNLRTVLPSFMEQRKIANYLDSKCSKINEIIAKQEQIIEKLKEYKLSVITEAVTKGLNSDVEMKDSGIDWIGEVPKHWSISKLKHLFGTGDDGLRIGPFGSAMKGKTLETGPYKIYNQAHLIQNDFSLNRHFVSEETFEELLSYEVKPGDILFSMMGTIGKCNIMPVGFPKGIMDSHLLKARLNEKIVPSFFVYAYDKDYSNQVIQYLLYISNGTIMNGLNSTILKNVAIALPPIKEQQEIVEYLDGFVSEIELRIAKMTKIVDKLQEYKKSLIYEVVTGKKEV